MHSFHYGTLPHTLSFYCHRPEHNRVTRYNANLNYSLPYTTTDRGQSSIRFSGPKSWVEVPKEIKDIAFRKPFTKKMKEYILNDLKEKNKDLPKTTFSYNEYKNKDYTDLLAIFNNEDDNTEFLGFDVQNLGQIFDDTFDEDYTFLGFNVANDIEEDTELLGSGICNLNQIFEDTFDENYAFPGFNVANNTPQTLDNIKHLFIESENEEEFVGF